MKRDKKDEYLAFWAEFGPVLKEGLIGYEVPDKDRILELLLAGSTKSTTELTSLEEYVSRMKEGQDSIYFLTGASKETVKSRPCSKTSSPRATRSYSSRTPSTSSGSMKRRASRTRRWSRSAGREIKLGSEEERKKENEALEDKPKEFGNLLANFRVHLQEPDQGGPPLDPPDLVRRLPGRGRARSHSLACSACSSSSVRSPRK